MSRLVGKPIAVVTGPDSAPCWVNGWEVLHVHSFHREWIGALEGEPERDVWRIETAQGVLELHLVHGTWALAKWED